MFSLWLSVRSSVVVGLLDMNRKLISKPFRFFFGHKLQQDVMAALELACIKII